MSDPNATATPEADYYASGSYQQGANPVMSVSSDQEYALRLQSEEFRNAQQVCPEAQRAWLFGLQYVAWLASLGLSEEVRLFAQDVFFRTSVYFAPTPRKT